MSAVHVHVHSCGACGREQTEFQERVLSLLENLSARVESLMAVSQEVRRVLDDLNGATNDVAAKVDRLQTSLADKLSPEEEAEFASISSRLRTLAADPTQPVPEEPPPSPEA